MEESGGIMELTGNHDLGPGVEEFVHGVYLAVDKATTLGLDRLRREDGVVPTCKRGCSCCCRYPIATNIAEAHTLAHYIKRELSAEQIGALEMRTRQWHQWDCSRPGRDPSVAMPESAESLQYEPCCPLLVDGACSVYPVRPLVCRTHFVSSNPRSCCDAIHPNSTQNIPVVLTSLVTASQPHSRAIRDHVEKACIDFSRSIMLLPQWLAIEMQWDFALDV